MDAGQRVARSRFRVMDKNFWRKIIEKKIKKIVGEEQYQNLTYNNINKIIENLK